MQLRNAIVGSIAATFFLISAPASATLITVTLSGNSERINDNANVFGQGAGLLTNLPFIETLLINTAVGLDASGGYSSNSVSNAAPPFAVSGSLSINGSAPFIVAGSNYGGAHDTTTTNSNPFFSSTTIAYSLVADDSVGPRLGNSLFVDLSGANLPTSLNKPISLTLTPDELSNVSFTDETSGAYLPDAIGNLYPTSLSVSVPRGAGSVPEPATWLSMICGFAVVGAALRRRETAFSTNR